VRRSSSIACSVKIAWAYVSIKSKLLPKGAEIFCWLSSANRDEAQFPEPEQFDIQRNPNKHVAFGYGIHFCMGAPLSRLEAAVALPILIEQLPDLQRDRSKPLEVYEGRTLFGFKHLPVVFTPSVPVGIG
jgi:cytochrome P450